MTKPKFAIKKNQHSDKDKEIHHHQPSSPTAASHCPVIQTLPLNFVAVAVARGVVVVWQCQGWWWWQ